MSIYVLQFLFIFFGDLITRKNDKLSKIFVFCVFISLVLIAGLRRPDMGLNDFQNGYIYGWKIAGHSSWNALLNYIGYNNSALKDPGFAVLCKLLSYISKDDFFFQFTISIPYYAVLCWFIKKYSKKLWISFFSAAVIQYFTLTYTLLRPMCALFFIFLATDAILENKKKGALVFMLLAGTMHTSAFVFLLSYLFKYLNPQKISFAIIGISIFLSLFGQSLIIAILRIILSNSRLIVYLYEERSEGHARFLISLLFYTLAYLKYSYLNNEDHKNIFFLNMSLVSCISLALTTITADFWRIALYFQISNVILISRSLQFYPKNERFLIEFMSIVTFMIYIFDFLYPGTNAIPYYTFFK